MHEILIYNKTKYPVSRELISGAILKSLNFLKIKQPIEMAVLIIGDKKIKNLNKTWRRKNKATNILSFPQLTRIEIKKALNFGSGSRKLEKFDLRAKSVVTLGEIVIDPNEILKSVSKNKKDFNKELKKLIIHGLLHLLGYDHKTPRQEVEMAKKEEELNY